MSLALGLILIVCWLLAMFVFKITKGVIHLVLLLAIVAIVIHFVSGV
jgi:hypothetical protein